MNIILDMDNTLLSMECLDAVIETALSAQLNPEVIVGAMSKVHAEMDKGMSGVASLNQTIPARIEIAKQLGAPVQKEHFDIVATIIPNTFTKGLVETLIQECSQQKRYPIKITVVSGGPQICVDAAVRELKRRFSASLDTKVSFSGHGNQIFVTGDGSFDQLRSKIVNSKIGTVKEAISDSAHSVMIGDGATDVEVYDAGVVSYFIALGLWVRRPVLFNRPENPPYYTKVDEYADLAPTLHSVIHEAQG